VPARDRRPFHGSHRRTRGERVASPPAGLPRVPPLLWTRAGAVGCRSTGARVARASGARPGFAWASTAERGERGAPLGLDRPGTGGGGPGDVAFGRSRASLSRDPCPGLVRRRLELPADSARFRV